MARLSNWAIPILWQFPLIFCIQWVISNSMTRLQKILFSGDMGASMVEDASRPLENFAAHIPKMKGFHQRYMCNNKVIRLWVQMVRTMDVEMIVPQHGTPFVGKEQINQFLDWIETLECGTDLMDETVFTCPE